MRTVTKISFSLEPLSDHEPPVYAIVPMIDGAALTDLIAAFEGNHHFEPVGGYGGIVPQFYNYGPLDRYLMGQLESDSSWEDLGGIYVLGCDCGEVGCWPLVCRIKVEGEFVVWDGFRQPHRPHRDYSQFGPFIFDASQYRRAVKELEALYAAESAAEPADES